MLRKLNPKRGLIYIPILLIALLVILSLWVFFCLFYFDECVCLFHHSLSFRHAVHLISRLIVLISHFLESLNILLFQLITTLSTVISRFASKYLGSKPCSRDFVLWFLKHYRVKPLLEHRSTVLNTLLLKLQYLSNLFGALMVQKLNQGVN